jgi:hypothetical protein
MTTSRLPSVGVCAIFKDEALYLREWMLFHWLQGVERFYLYDNGSTDDWRAQIPELADSVIPWPGPVVQMAAYDDCLNRKPDVDWLAFIDIDEYLWDSTTRTLNEALMPVRASAVHVPWLMFGDGGHAQRSKRLTIDTYLRRAADYETLGKMIVRPGRARGCKTPHDFYIRGKVKTVDTLRLCHYWTRSEAEVRIKFNRGQAAWHATRPISEYLAERDRLFEVVDGSVSEAFGAIMRKETRATRRRH